jgi:hypothetical protein
MVRMDVAFDVIGFEIRSLMALVLFSFELMPAPSVLPVL